MIKILNKHHLGCVPKDTIYAGRGSVFGNPFPISPAQDRDKDKRTKCARSFTSRCI